MLRRTLAILGLATLPLAGCASAPLLHGPDEWVRQAEPSAPSRIDRRLEKLTDGREAGLSGLRLLESGEDALLARLALANLAERSIDIQSYIWELDVTGRLLISRLLAAADRGVRVRILLDDTATRGHENEWLALDGHPNLSLRTFNPFRSSPRSLLSKALEFAFDFARLNRRMHNKTFVADGAAVILGGRNVADDYFALDPIADFRDLEILCVGPGAGASSVAFDVYWNSAWSFPVRQKRSRAAVPGALERFRRGPDVVELARFPYDVWLDPAEQDRALDRLRPRLVWAKAELLSDPPEKVEEGLGSVPGRELHRLASEARQEISAEIAYLILPEPGIELLRTLARRGVTVRLLTNSLASNDVVAAHAGYAKHRPELLATGVLLHEFRPRGDLGPLRKVVRAPKSIARLHVKAGVIDHRYVFVGSLNLDGRSLAYNTENLLIVDSPELAAEVERYFVTGFAPESSWVVEPRKARQPELAGRRAGGRPIWIQDLETPQEQVFRKEPRAGSWRRFVARLIRLLPIEGLL